MDTREYGAKVENRIQKLLEMEGMNSFPVKYTDYGKLDHWLKKLIGNHLPLVLSDDYEHFMACLPGKKYAAQHVLIRKQIGGFTTVCGYWKWLEFLSQRITRDKVELMADFMSGKHNGHPRQFDKDFWLKNADENDGWMPIRIEYPGEGATFTGVPFPVAQVYGATPAVWLNEPMYIHIGHLTHVATVAGQFAEILGNPWRFIEVMFRALQNKEGSDDVLLAMLIGGGIISTSNDLGAFINGAPFKCAGTTGHCYYQQYPNLKDALRKLLGSELGKYATVLLDVYQHEHGFKELQEVLTEGYEPPFAERPDSGDTLALGMHDLTVLQDGGNKINVVFEDGYSPKDVLKAEKERKQFSLSEERAMFGAGSGFLAPRRALEAAYKACMFHNGTVEEPEDIIETMKICLDDKMKQSIAGLIDWFYNEKTGMYTIGSYNEHVPQGFISDKKVLYDGLTTPGQPYFNPEYEWTNLANCTAIKNGIAKSKETRKILGPDFTRDIGENRNGVAMTKILREKRKEIYQRALNYIKS